MSRIQQKIKLLKDYFAKRDDIVMAFAFGSWVQEMETEDSDVDIAVYIKPEKKAAQTEEYIKFEQEDEIRPEVIGIVDKDLDLICMNNAPAPLVSNIIKTGTPLKIKDERLYWDTYLKASLEAEDFWEFTRGYFEIYKKS